MPDKDSKKGRIEERKTALKIINYLQNFPEALDTAKGIATWWLREDPLRVEAALVRLVALGILEVKKFGAEEYFSLGPSHRGNASLQEVLAEVFAKKAATPIERFGGARRPRPSD